MRQQKPLILLDSCAVVNLYATRWQESILTLAGGPFAVVDAVARETRYVLRGGAGADARDREPVDLQPLLYTGLLFVIATDVEEELATFVDLVLNIDEGEAMTGAIAIHRGCVVVTDDRKAGRVLAARGVRLRSSLDLIRVWGEHPTITSETLRTALTDLRQRGNYIPAMSHPLRAWWDETTGIY